jgi:hypothetical protein
MKSERDPSAGGVPSDAQCAERGAERFELWLDGLLPPEAAREFERELERSPELRARAAQQRAIDEALRRRYARGPREAAPIGATPARPPQLAGTGASPWRTWAALAAAALALAGAAAWYAAHREASTPSHAQRPIARGDRSFAPVGGPCELDTVFASAVQCGFAPMEDAEDVRAQGDAWKARLIASLDQPGCNEEEPTVVIGDWKDPRVSLADMMMLRVGGEPVMLVVPRSDSATGLCVRDHARLHLHRGCLDGRTVYELSESPESRVLACVRADHVEPARF